MVRCQSTSEKRGRRERVAPGAMPWHAALGNRSDQWGPGVPSRYTADGPPRGSAEAAVSRRAARSRGAPQSSMPSRPSTLKGNRRERRPHREPTSRRRGVPGAPRGSWPLELAAPSSPLNGPNDR